MTKRARACAIGPGLPDRPGVQGYQFGGSEARRVIGTTILCTVQYTHQYTSIHPYYISTYNMIKYKYRRTKNPPLDFALSGSKFYPVRCRDFAEV